MNSDLNRYSIHWFRRDLRLEGNQILQEELRRQGGRVLTVFCFDRVFLSRPDFSWNRFSFFLQTLKALKNQIEELGGVMLVLDEGPREAFPKLLGKLKKTKLGLPQTITFNRDYEPFARLRDSDLTRIFTEQYQVEVKSDRDHLFIEPHELEKGSNGFYQVFTPFKKKWYSLFQSPPYRQRMESIAQALQQSPLKFRLPEEDWADLSTSTLETWLMESARQVSIPIPKVGFQRAKQQAIFFGSKKLMDYAEKRDIPGEAGTSQLSIYFKNGSLTPPMAIALMSLDPNQAKPAKYFDELVWREFYYHILWHAPRVETESFLPQYRDLNWENNESHFEAWKKGQTGYPIVDAGMRQLNQTGWMHNRVRMIVASFLVKDLLIDWRWGERYFMEKLLDGDLAPNNGGWQWAASTGCDPQPYFRIFNPTLQAERFDPSGDYILKYVPELKNRNDGGSVHDPYHPIVEHAAQKNKALALFKAAR